MPGRQTKYTHICDRTFMRPRDMIKFCNEILEAHRRGQGDDRFINADLIEARREYSGLPAEGTRRRDPAKHVPDYKLYLDVLQPRSGARSSRAASFWKPGRSGHISPTRIPRRCCRKLFRSAPLSGYFCTGGGGGGSKYAWRYLDARPHRAVLPADAKTLRVYPGFKEALDLIKGGALAEPTRVPLRWRCWPFGRRHYDATTSRVADLGVRLGRAVLSPAAPAVMRVCGVSRRVASIAVVTVYAACHAGGRGFESRRSR